MEVVLGVHHGRLCWGKLRQHIQQCPHCISVVVDDGHMQRTEGGGGGGGGGAGKVRT